jgi:hypothetical protein
MLDFTTSQFIQVIIALSVGTGIFLAGYLLPEKYTVTALILLIPFQFIESEYGSVNMVLTYLLGIALIVKGKLNQFPLLSWILLILFAYMLSFSQVHISTYSYHLPYLISIGSNFVLFYIVYNYIVNERDYKLFFNIIIILNILVIAYALIQFQLGFEEYSLFEIKELSIEKNKLTNRGEAFRLRGGPFKNIGMNAEYMVIQIMILGYLVIFGKGKWKKALLLGLIALNTIILIGTGNRGGFFSLIFGGLLFFFIYRKELGLIKMSGIIFSFIAIILTMSIITVTYTEYDSLFFRVKKTKFVQGMPENRYKIWNLVINEFKKRPIFGHGPRLHKVKKVEQFQEGKKYTLIPQPHNLYLYLLVTLGIIGFAAYACFWAKTLQVFQKAFKLKCNDIFLNNIPKLGILILAVFLFDQMKLEFLRYKLNDYQHFIFILFGAFIGFAHLLAIRTVDDRQNILDEST